MNECSTPNASKSAQIIEAAVAEFQEKGFAAASMDRISARAEVSKRTLYKYFESKENLFRSIVIELSSRFAEVLEIRYEKGRDIREQLTELAWAEGRILMLPDVIAMARMVISETLRNPVLAAEAQGKLDKTATFIAMLKDAAEDGQLRIDDPEQAGQEFIGLIKARAFWPLLFTGGTLTKAEMEDTIESSVQMMISRYGIDPDLPAS
ncbi:MULTISPECIES: TetR/AcrR family transcriptional regulator [unclassified Ruegeria]|uniref:TetR/AcrR family transcriptional regulator n=1 Tax=unclassified Ruegeria TaxID=2625375 RepID=UPI001489C329|nr:MULTISPECIES: TetR/AcrR family transcriptional regulator [unclassified Ruegeria]NOD35886.1 TetR family transcriptional regulator [Ruegeria sp. HKCCD7296]NOD47104.1 TetR family transcriptional regulator [Ruegeria sp. HKCCD5849]NOD51427.1 TetR family transcriptional regulator [Ruegeria sp. HKCCD5851]NOD68248.1 TetR family transcriptional regulator [Ruegeria sp. HKCCD7303]NOE36411.1 TetR family transcriptional regulator [Ruegeria sp. HKCCD7318]